MPDQVRHDNFMDKFIIDGPTKLQGTVTIGGAKNVALKILIASLLTDDEIIIRNVPQLRDVRSLIQVLESLGVVVREDGNVLHIKKTNTTDAVTVPFDIGGSLRTSSLVLGPLLARFGKGNVPNPGGCRLGARPIDRHIKGLEDMGAVIRYDSQDGYFHGRAEKLHGTTVSFPKNTHTGTEAIILAAVLAEGETLIENAAEEIEIDDLITCLKTMGADIKRTKNRIIHIQGVKQLHGVDYTIMPDRNEEITFAIAAAITDGNIIVNGSQRQSLTAFLEVFARSGGGWEAISDTQTRYFRKSDIKPSDIVTQIHPGFMTDWQAPWAVFMTQANGVSTIHETVFESRFCYVKELQKMGAKIEFYDPEVQNPEQFYNFNWEDRREGFHQGIRISGPTALHNAVLKADDLRAGATLVLAALVACGRSYIHGVELIDRGYEHIEERLQKLGAHIERVTEDVIV